MKDRYYLMIIVCCFMVFLTYREEKGMVVNSSSIEKVIALTFDDGPHPDYTKKLLEGLKKRDVKVTFFLIGKSIDGNEDLVKQMKSDGHLIGNHGHDHVIFTKEHSDEVCQEVNQTNQKIFEITGEMPTYVRPPFGNWNEKLECIVPMTVVFWDVDTLDWKTQNKNQIVQYVLKKVDNNNIILMHDVFEPSVEAALEIIDVLKEQGYSFVTVDELMVE